MINGMLVHFKSHPRKFPEHFARGCPGIHFHKALEITGSTVAKDRPLRRTYGWFSLRGDRSVRAHSRSRIDVKHIRAQCTYATGTRAPPGHMARTVPLFSSGGEETRGLRRVLKIPTTSPLRTTRVSLASFSLPLSRSFRLS